jgi:hypothetical protein
MLWRVDVGEHSKNISSFNLGPDYDLCSRGKEKMAYILARINNISSSRALCGWSRRIRCRDLKIQTSQKIGVVRKKPGLTPLLFLEKGMIAVTCLLKSSRCASVKRMPLRLSTSPCRPARVRCFADTAYRIPWSHATGSGSARRRRRHRRRKNPFVTKARHRAMRHRLALHVSD